MAANFMIAGGFRQHHHQRKLLEDVLQCMLHASSPPAIVIRDWMTDRFLSPSPLPTCKGTMTSIYNVSYRLRIVSIAALETNGVVITVWLLLQRHFHCLCWRYSGTTEDNPDWNDYHVIKEGVFSSITLTASSSVVGAILQMGAFSIAQLMVGHIIAGNRAQLLSTDPYNTEWIWLR